jgi:hypothetical protein
MGASFYEQPRIKLRMADHDEPRYGLPRCSRRSCWRTHSSRPMRIKHLSRAFGRTEARQIPQIAGRNESASGYGPSKPLSCVVLGKHGTHGPVRHDSFCKGAPHRAAVASHEQTTVRSSGAPERQPSVRPNIPQTRSDSCALLSAQIHDRNVRSIRSLIQRAWCALTASLLSAESAARRRRLYPGIRLRAVAGPL